MIIPGTPGWLNVLLAISAGLGAVYVVWKRGLKPLSRFLTDADELGPVIRDMAKQVNKNGTSSLKEDLAEIRSLADGALAAASAAATTAHRCEEGLDRIREILEKKVVL